MRFSGLLVYFQKESVHLKLNKYLICAMYTAATIPGDHKDLIHDVAYDWYGRRLATCSSDQVLTFYRSFSKIMGLGTFQKYYFAFIR
jgi:hypothetical protein